jgi:mRNA interferase RelE/StbE
MVYQLKLHKHVQKFLSALPPVWRERFIEKFDLLKENPFHHPQLDIKPMQGTNPQLYRLRIGSYRVIYQIQNEQLIVYLMEAGNRGDVYK